MVITLTFPRHADLKVKKGDDINFGDDLYSLSAEKLVRINVSDRLGIKPDSIFQHTAKIIGEEVKKGDVLAFKKGILRTKKIKSEWDATLLEINHEKGEIVLSVEKLTSSKRSKKGKSKVKKSNFKGTVEETKKNLLKIDIKGGEKIDLEEVEKDGRGEVFYFKQEAIFFKVTEDDLEGKIVVVKELESHINAKCIALGASGFVFLTSDQNTVDSNLPFAKIKGAKEYEKIAKLEKKYILFSQADKIAVLYD